MGGTRGSGIVSSTADVLRMSVVRGLRGVGGVWLYVSVSCESGFFVYMAGPGICILC